MKQELCLSVLSPILRGQDRGSEAEGQRSERRPLSLCPVPHFEGTGQRVRSKDVMKNFFPGRKTKQRDRTEGQRHETRTLSLCPVPHFEGTGQRVREVKQDLCPSVLSPILRGQDRGSGK